MPRAILVHFTNHYVTEHVGMEFVEWIAAQVEILKSSQLLEKSRHELTHQVVG